MGNIDKLKQHHVDIKKIAEDMNGHLDEEALSKNATEVRTLMTSIGGKLLVHLSGENSNVYPPLLASEDANVKAVAKKFQDEIESVKAAVSAYTANWPTAASIEGKPAEFIAETKKVFAMLTDRMAREDKELYTLLPAEDAQPQ
ncbi:hypothetical protein MNBD_DELTA01-1131 [hydrothermal vent metagenome]|uniref:Hemerythrin-like domain-containing protein n=1 Tax=hydrothermal vent metagenome TaxID=652676 RepID=A0A3B0RIY8_9ZZZZ